MPSECTYTTSSFSSELLTSGQPSDVLTKQANGVGNVVLGATAFEIECTLSEELKGEDAKALF